MNDNEVLIKIDNLHKTFDKHEVLKGISTTISKGEVIAIIGPSGCGKSTFLRSLNLLEVPTKGTVTFEGNDITAPHVDIDKTRERI
jgi:polar amino acid transport system ATP-binding protein